MDDDQVNKRRGHEEQETSRVCIILHLHAVTFKGSLILRLISSSEQRRGWPGAGASDMGISGSRRWLLSQARLENGLDYDIVEHYLARWLFENLHSNTVREEKTISIVFPRIYAVF